MSHFLYVKLSVTTKVMFILSSISIDLQSSSVTPTLIYENSESKLFKNISFLKKISNTWTNGLLGTNVYKTLEFCP